MLGIAAYRPAVIITCHVKCIKFRVQNHFRAQRCQKYALYQKNVSNKSCQALNFVQKCQRAHMCTPITGAELGAFKDCHH